MTKINTNLETILKDISPEDRIKLDLQMLMYGQIFIEMKDGKFVKIVEPNIVGCYD